MATETTPVDEAEQILRRVAMFRRMGLDELDASALARSNVNYAEVCALLRKGCPLKLVASILS
jgi:hypothetical protein